MCEFNTSVHIRIFSLTRFLRKINTSSLLETCFYSGLKIYPGHGKRMVRTDGRLHIFLNTKCERSFKMKRNPRNVNWTVLYRRKHKKKIASDQPNVAKNSENKTAKFEVTSYFDRGTDTMVPDRYQYLCTGTGRIIIPEIDNGTLAEEASKKKTRKTHKFQRPIGTSSLAELLAKRNQKPEFREAQRAQLIKEAKEKKKTVTIKKTEKAKAAKVQQPKQKAAKPVKTQAPRVGGKR
uniref:Large ribosomal subunit protein eL24 n=1 Tax=Romanomermis culicivorax TaxID=13658 RepID=A0A915HND6_ROMCU